LNENEIAFCPKCGKEVSKRADFCHRCGANLADLVPNRKEEKEEDAPSTTNEPPPKEEVIPGHDEKKEPDIIDLSSLDAMARQEKEGLEGELTHSEESPSTGRFQICPMCGAEFFLEASLLEEVPLKVKCRECDHEVMVRK